MLTLDQALAFRIYRVQRLLRLHLVRLLEDVLPGLAPEHFFLLMRLGEKDGVAQHTLVDPVIGDRPNISRHLVRMEKMGLVLRQPDPEDARSRCVHLTSEGRDVLGQLQVLIGPERARLFPMPQAELDTFAGVLDQLEQILEG